MQHVTTASGTVYHVDAEKRSVLRESSRALVGEKGWIDTLTGDWQEYATIGFVDDKFYVTYADGQWSLSTPVSSVTNDNGEPADFLLLGQSFLPGEQLKYDAVEVPQLPRDSS